MPPGPSPNQDKHVLHLRAEQLAIAKVRIKTGGITVHKETHVEDKTLTVPVTREELVIERQAPAGNIAGEEEGQKETIRIPISEERIEVVKLPVNLEDVSISKREYVETKCVEEILRSEKLRVATEGGCKIIDEDSR